MVQRSEHRHELSFLTSLPQKLHYQDYFMEWDVERAGNPSTQESEAGDVHKFQAILVCRMRNEKKKKKTERKMRKRERERRKKKKDELLSVRIKG